MACPHPGVRRLALGRRGAKPGFKSKGGLFHPGGYRRGEDRTGELREPSECLVIRPLSMGSAAGCRDWLLRDVVGARPEVASVGVSTVVPGV